MGGFDLMWNDGPVSQEEGAADLSGTGSSMTNTHLGMSCQAGVGTGLRPGGGGLSRGSLRGQLGGLNQCSSPAL